MYQVTQWQFETNEVRTIDKDGETWWVLKDVCVALGMGDNRAGEVAKRLDEDEYDSIVVVNSNGKPCKAYVVNESGLYAVILRSDKPQAKPFRKWVTGEVLPEIRRTGSYSIVSSEQVSVMQSPSVQNYIAQLNNRLHFPESACKVVVQNYFREHIGFAPPQNEIQIAEIKTSISEKNGIVEDVTVYFDFTIGTRQYHMRASNHDGLGRKHELECEYITRLDKVNQGIF